MKILSVAVLICLSGVSSVSFAESSHDYEFAPCRFLFIPAVGSIGEASQPGVSPEQKQACFLVLNEMSEDMLVAAYEQGHLNRPELENILSFIDDHWSLEQSSEELPDGEGWLSTGFGGQLPATMIQPGL